MPRSVKQVVGSCGPPPLRRTGQSKTMGRSRPWHSRRAGKPRGVAHHDHGMLRVEQSAEEVER